MPAFVALGIGLCACTNTLTNLHGRWSLLGRVSTFGALVIPPAACLLLTQPGTRWNPLAIRPLAGLALLATAYIPRIGGDPNLVPLTQLGLVSAFFFGASSLRWTRASRLAISGCARVWVLMLGGLWAWGDFETPFLGFYTNPNATGACAAFMLPIGLLAADDGKLGRGAQAFGLLAAAVVAGTMARAAILAIAVGTVAYVGWPLIVRSRFRYRTTFWLLLAGIAAFVLGQSLLVERLHDLGLQALSQQLTGKNLGTREGLWTILVDQVYEHPWFGCGPTVSLGYLLDDDLSAHCIYLQIALQAGLIGLAVLLAVLSGLWQSFWPGRHDPRVRLSGATLLAVMAHQTFEVSLTQNNLAFGYLGWVTIAAGCSRAWELALERGGRAATVAARRAA